jgi:hypothetical protein
MDVSGQLHAPATLPPPPHPGKNPGTQWLRGRVGARAHVIVSD